MALLIGVGAEQPEQVGTERPRVVQVFWPVNRQPPAASSRTAFEVIAARSLPALGSDQPWHHRSSADAIRGRNRSCCSWVPYSKMVGANRKMPFWVTRWGAPAR